MTVSKLVRFISVQVLIHLTLSFTRPSAGRCEGSYSLIDSRYYAAISVSQQLTLALALSPLSVYYLSILLLSPFSHSFSILFYGASLSLLSPNVSILSQKKPSIALSDCCYLSLLSPLQWPCESSINLSPYLSLFLSKKLSCCAGSFFLSPPSFDLLALFGCRTFSLLLLPTPPDLLSFCDSGTSAMHARSHTLFLSSFRLSQLRCVCYLIRMHS